MSWCRRLLLPSAGWQVDCSECVERKGDISLSFTRGSNKLEIILPNMHLEAGKNDFMVVIIDVKNEAELNESVIKECEDYP